MINLKKSTHRYLIVLCLFFISTVFLSLSSRLVHPQATIDGAYYHIMAGQLEKGAGFTEPFIWHFLSDYNNLEHPMDYWMPLGIVFFFLARLCAGVAGEIWLNFVVWSILSVLVFIEVKKITNSFLNAAFAYCTMLFCGRYLFYLLTTDNMAFYALFGFFLFKQLGSKKSRWYFTAVISALVALTRIEGFLIALFCGLCEFYRCRRITAFAGYLIILSIALSPWMIRNYQTLGHPWPSNSKALFLRQYDDMFRRNATLTLDNYLSLGSKKILEQKARGIGLSILNLVIAPGMFVMYPFWLAGLLKLWKQGGKFFFLLLVFFVIFCGLVIPIQSDKGSALHISAFFLPFYAILNGVGFSMLKEHYQMRRSRYLLISSIVVLWLMFASHYSVNRLVNEYAADNGPYESLFAEISFDERRIVSSAPVKVYLETCAQGVISSSYNESEPLKLADAFACDVIITDRRASGYKPLPKASGWQEIASNTYLNVFFRLSTMHNK